MSIRAIHRNLDTAAPLRAAYDSKRERNSSYSLRAFARDLGLSPAYVSLLMSGKRAVTPELILEIAPALGLTKKQIQSWNKKASATGPLADDEAEDFVELSLDRFQFVADWWNLAVLDMTLLDDFVEDASVIARRLGIKPHQVERAWQRAFKLGLLERDAEGRLRKTSAKLIFPTSRSEPAIRSFHRGMIHRALGELDHPERFESREIGGTVIAANPERIQEAKKRIAAFRREILNFLTEAGPRTQLYQFNTQLFNLTEEESKK